MLEKMRIWTPPDNWQRITTIDAHTGGEPFRITTGGRPELEGDTILERRRFMTGQLDHLRTALMWDPRGHADMCDAVVPEVEGMPGSPAAANFSWIREILWKMGLFPVEPPGITAFLSSPTD